MKVVAQLGLIAVLAAAGGGAWAYREPLLSVVGLGAAPTAGAQGGGGGPGGGGPGGGRPGGGGAGRAVAVSAQPAQTGPIVESVEAVGTTLANESVTITTKITGLVRDIAFESGQTVRGGQVLVRLDDREELAELDQARAAREQARQTLVRTRQLLETRAAPQARVDELEQQFRAADGRVRVVEARLQDLVITAPFSGRVGIRRISVGALVQPNTVITTLDDTSIIKLRFDVPETVLASIGTGSTVVARSSAFEDRSFEGRVAVVDTRVDPVSRAIEVRAELPNPDDSLKPGMFMTVEIVTARRPNAILIPEESLVPEGNRQFVYVVNNGRAERREVQIGSRVPGVVEVREGLAAGAMVVTGGVQRLRDGAVVRIVGGQAS